MRSILLTKSMDKSPVCDVAENGAVRHWKGRSSAKWIITTLKNKQKKTAFKNNLSIKLN